MSPVLLYRQILLAMGGAMLAAGSASADATQGAPLVQGPLPAQGMAPAPGLQPEQALQPAQGSQPAEGPAPVQRRIRLTLLVENPSGTAVADGSAWLYGPAGRTATQELQSLEIDTPHRVRQDVAGNTIVELDHLHLGPYETRVVTLSAQLAMRSEPAADPLVPGATFLGPQPFIEADDPMIRQLAAQLRGQETGASAAAIYDWVRSHIIYSGYVADELGARYAMEHRRGDCTEFADLSAALSRAMGIPARVLGGYVVNGDAVLRARDYHNWAEVRVNDTWKLLDAQKGNLGVHADRYIAFHVVSARTPEEMRGAERFRAGDGLVVRLN